VEYKNKSIGLIIATLVVLSLSLLKPTLVRAESYSNEDNRKTLSVDKKLRSVSDSKYVDNISSSTKTFFQGDLIEFQIKIENTGTGVLKNIKVTDSLPPFLKLIFFTGTYDKTNNKVEWTIDELKAGEAKDYLIRARIDQATNVTQLTKETNVAEARVDELGERDDASYYIGGVSVPETGDASLLIKTGILFSLGLGGILFRKYARGY